MDKQYLPATWDQYPHVCGNNMTLDNLLQYGLSSSRPGINLQLHSTPLAVGTSEKTNVGTSTEGLFNISSLASPMGSLTTDEGYSSISTPISLPRGRQAMGIDHQRVQSMQPTERNVFPNGCGGDLFNRQRYLQTPNISAYTAQRLSNPAFAEDWLSSRYSDHNTFFNTNALNTSLAGETMNARRNSAFAEPVKAKTIDHFRNSLLLNENRSPYQQTITQIRQEMINLIELGMHHLEGYLKGMPPRYLDNDVFQVNPSNATTPLNLKSDNPGAGFITEYSQPSLPTGLWRPMDVTPVTPLVSNGNHIHVTTTDVPMTSKDKSSCGRYIKSPQKQMKQRRRRIRIRTSGYRNRFGQTTGDRLLTPCSISQIRLPLSPLRNVPDGGLDLRVKQDRSRSQIRAEESINGCPNKHTSLSASHLKRAKIMFMYGRYPSSNLLKVYFPDVAFTRATIAQVVKWFSNFREFFYIQIEKYVRQYVIQGNSMKEDIVLDRNHELFSTLEKHYNKDNEVESPNEFIRVIEVALREFTRAITSHHDRDPGWKREIYRNVVPYDCPIPHFIKDIN